MSHKKIAPHLSPFSRRIQLTLLGAFSAGIFTLISTAPVSAATIVVNDQTAAGSATTCSLSDALAAAETNTAVNGCTAGDAYPTMDVISLGSGTYAMVGSAFILETVAVTGTSVTSTTIDTTLGRMEIWPIHTSTQTHAYSFGNFSQTATLRLTTAGDSISVLSLHDVAIGGVNVSQSNTAHATTTVVNSQIGTDGVSVNNQSSNPGDTTISSSRIAGNGSSSLGISYSNPNAAALFTLQNSVITGFLTGVINNECSAGGNDSLHVTNSMIGGAGMRVGIADDCGHLVIRDSTFHNISGSALIAHTNHTDGITHFSSRVDATNTTFTAITPDGSTYGTPAIPLWPCALSGVITICTEQANPTATGSSLRLQHTTVAGNTLGAFAAIHFEGTANLCELTLQNNALEGTPVSGSYSAAPQTIADNLTTGSAQPGMANRTSFVLGALQDNGGTAPIGILGADGHVLTLRPLYGSPLINGAPGSA